MAMVATSTQQKLGVNSFIQEFQTHYNKGKGKSKNKDCRRSASIGTETKKLLPSLRALVRPPIMATAPVRGAPLEGPSR